MKNLFLVLFLFVGLSASAQFKNNNPRIFNIVNYGAKGDGKNVFDGAMGATTTTLTSATAAFTSADVGKAIRVPKAGASGHALVTTIASFSNSTTVILAAPSVGAVSADTIIWGTDNTAAIQAAMTALGVVNGGEVYVPAGWFIVAGALQTSVGGTNPNAQLTWPISTLADASFNLRTHFVMRGESKPQYTPGSWQVDSLTPHNNSVIETIIDGSGNMPAIFGGRANDAGDIYQNRNSITYRGLTILVPKNRENGGASIGGINGYYFASTEVIDCVVSVDGAILTTVQPTNEAAGIVLCQIGSEVFSRAVNVQINGFKYGIVVSDEAVLDHVTVNANVNGFVFTQCEESIAAYFISAHWNIHSIYVPTGTILGVIPVGNPIFTIENINCEVFSGSSYWYEYADIVNDVANRGVATVNYSISRATCCVNQTLFNKTGGTGIICSQIGLPSPIANVLYSGNIAASGQQLLMPGFNQTNFQFSVGSALFQPYNLNNFFVSDNGYFNGTNYVRQAAGYASQIQFNNGDIYFKTGANSTLGSTIVWNIPLHIFLSNNVVFGDGATNFDNSTASVQAMSTSKPQFAWHYDNTHYTTGQTNSTGNFTLTPSAGGFIPAASISYKLVNVSATGSYAATATDYTIQFTGSTATLVYPTVNLLNGRHLNLVNNASGSITIPSTKSGNASTITTLTTGQRAIVEYDLTNTTWIVVSLN